MFCQEKNTAVEIYLGTEGVVPASKKITFYMMAQSTVWGGTKGPPKEYWITDKFDKLNYTPPTNNNNYSYWSGFDFALSSTVPPFYDIFGCGLYKIVSSENPNYYFYIDYRDTRYGSYTGSIGHNADIWIKYFYSSCFY